MRETFAVGRKRTEFSNTRFPVVTTLQKMEVLKATYAKSSCAQRRSVSVSGSGSGSGRAARHGAHGVVEDADDEGAARAVRDLLPLRQLLLPPTARSARSG